MLSLNAQNEDEASFVVEVKNKCRTIALESPQWLDTLVKFDFRNAEKRIEFDRAFFAGNPECDDFGINYKLLDQNGDIVSASFYQLFDLTQPYFRINAP